MSLWISLPILVVELLCIAGLHWSEHTPVLDEREQTIVGTACAAVAAAGGAVLVVAWWRGW